MHASDGEEACAKIDKTHRLPSSLPEAKLQERSQAPRLAPREPRLGLEIGTGADRPASMVEGQLDQGVRPLTPR